MIKFDRDAWSSFVKDLSPQEIEYLEEKACFLFDVVNREIGMTGIESDENMESDLDLDFGVYMSYSECTEKKYTVSPWIVHDSWLKYYIGDKNLDSKIKSKIKDIYERKNQETRQDIFDIRDFLLLSCRVKKECDAVVWLSFLDFMVTMVLFKIQEKRIKRVIYCLDDIGI